MKPFGQVLTSPLEHAKWLNTLSYLENCGARLIARSEHPTMVPREILKHASEEFRHAYYFKSLITKVYSEELPSYALDSLLGGIKTYHFMQKLNVTISRMLKNEGFTGVKFKELAYLLVTYAIEMRAMEIYPSYQLFLEENGFPFSIKGVIREEEGHLSEIEESLVPFQGVVKLKGSVLQAEKMLFKEWSSLYDPGDELRNA